MQYIHVSSSLLVKIFLPVHLLHGLGWVRVYHWLLGLGSYSWYSTFASMDSTIFKVNRLATRYANDLLLGNESQHHSSRDLKGANVFFTNRKRGPLTIINYTFHALYIKVMLAISFHRFV